MSNDSIVPECDAARLPLPASSDIVGGVDMFAQEVESVNALLSFELTDMDDEAWVVEEGLLLRHRMCSDLLSDVRTLREDGTSFRAMPTDVPGGQAHGTALHRH